MTEHTRALLAEAAGTFWFVVIGAGAIVAQVIAGSPPTALLAIALAHGLALSVAISTFGAISGGHFNPAVTLALAIARKHPWNRVLTYSGAQLAGALLAGLVLRLAFDHLPANSPAHGALLGTPALGDRVGVVTAIFVEMVLTIFLVWAVFGTAVASNAPRIAGFGIGLTVAADILIGGPITGAAMNPARWFGPAVVSGSLVNGFVYWIGPLLGAALAAVSYRYVFGPPEDRGPIRASEIPIPRVQPAPPRPSDRTERI